MRERHLEGAVGRTLTHRRPGYLELLQPACAASPAASAAGVPIRRTGSLRRTCNLHKEAVVVEQAVVVRQGAAVWGAAVLLPPGPPFRRCGAAAICPRLSACGQTAER